MLIWAPHDYFKTGLKKLWTYPIKGELYKTLNRTNIFALFKSLFSIRRSDDADHLMLFLCWLFVLSEPAGHPLGRPGWDWEGSGILGNSRIYLPTLYERGKVYLTLCSLFDNRLSLFFYQHILYTTTNISPRSQGIALHGCVLVKCFSPHQ